VCQRGTTRSSAQISSSQTTCPWPNTEYSPNSQVAEMLEPMGKPNNRDGTLIRVSGSSDPCEPAIGAWPIIKKAPAFLLTLNTIYSFVYCIYIGEAVAALKPISSPHLFNTAYSLPQCGYPSLISRMVDQRRASLGSPKGVGIPSSETERALEEITS
jgi:hypothetical protein